jgi:hypothetical protein
MRATDCPNRRVGAGRGRRGRTAGSLAAAALAAVVLAGCKEERQQQQATKAPKPDLTAKAVAAAQEAVSAGVRAPGEAKFRAVQSWRQAMPRTVAVCGQVSPKGTAYEAFVPFVAVIEFGGGSDPSPIHIEQHAATSSTEATRVYGEMVARCLEDGGPHPLGPHRTITEPLPPMPSGLPRTEQAANPPPAAHQAAEPAPAVPPVAGAPVVAAPVAVVAAIQAPPGQTAVPRQNVNLHTEPQGPVSRVVPKGAELRVFAQAAGGWYEVGDEEQPWGWIHGTMLDVR